MKSINYKEILNSIARDESSGDYISDNDLKQLKKCILDMTVDLDERCRRNGINLFLVGGSLLGAVRHKGFIPWDEDMDLGLFRDDYEKLKDIFDSEFSDDYVIRCPNMTEPCGCRFMQIFRKGTVLKVMGEDSPLIPQMVYIDVFPYDYVPQNPLVRKIRGIKANILMFIASCVKDEKDINEEYKEFVAKAKSGRLFLKIRRITGRLFSYREPWIWFNRIDKAIRYNDTDTVTSATGRRHYFGEIYPKEVFDPLKEIEFEGHRFYAPSKWEEYLKGNYGEDYMTPAEPDNRESHFITEVRV